MRFVTTLLAVTLGLASTALAVGGLNEPVIMALTDSAATVPLPRPINSQPMTPGARVGASAPATESAALASTREAALKPDPEFASPHYAPILARYPPVPAYAPPPSDVSGSVPDGSVNHELGFGTVAGEGGVSLALNFDDAGAASHTIPAPTAAEPTSMHKPAPVVPKPDLKPEPVPAPARSPASVPSSIPASATPAPSFTPIRLAPWTMPNVPSESDMALEAAFHSHHTMALDGIDYGRIVNTMNTGTVTRGNPNSNDGRGRQPRRRPGQRQGQGRGRRSRRGDTVDVALPVRRMKDVAQLERELMPLLEQAVRRGVDLVGLAEQLQESFTREESEAWWDESVD